MNYQKIYDQIIERARKEGRKKGEGVYYEAHHIVPKCLGGKNTKSNLILLTAKEHFLCHWLLHRLYPTDHRLSYAFWMMCRVRNIEQGDRYIPSATTFAEAKQSAANANSKLKKGVPSIKKGSKLSKEHIGKLSIARKGKPTAKRGRKYPHLHGQQEVIICPSCGKEGGTVNMQRYHFDNCGKKSPVKGSKRSVPNKNRGVPGPGKSEDHKRKISNTLGMSVLDTVTGISYPSIKSAAFAIGVDPGTIRNRIKKGLFTLDQK